MYQINNSSECFYLNNDIYNTIIHSQEFNQKLNEIKNKKEATQKSKMIQELSQEISEKTKKTFIKNCFCFYIFYTFCTTFIKSCFLILFFIFNVLILLYFF